MSTERRAPIFDGWSRLAAAAAICAAGCSSARDQAPPPARTATSAAATPPRAPAGTATAASAAAPAQAPASAAPPPPAPLAASAAPAAPVAGPAARPKDGPYGRFFAALRELEQGERKEHVRIAWLGDSHGAADFWSGALRTALQKRFGRGGPGFVHVGFEGYRHDGMKIGVEGKWKMRPRGPATTLVTGDGVFGLGGILFSADSGGTQAKLTLADAGLTGKLRWDICYRLNGPTDQVGIAVTGTPSFTVKASAEEPPGELRHATAGSDPAATLAVTPTAGAPELCGAIIETDPTTSPGVVLDTLGINGARLGTPLAWNEASWAAELARRPPALVILEYGTNESGDFNADAAMYAKQVGEVVARVRKVSPDVDCLALAPTDRRDTPDRTPVVRDAIREGAKAAGCGFWDTYETMGGKGSIDAWSKESPPRAAKDGVHLTSRGYRELGVKLFDDLMRIYNP
ncbi:MAG: hypothetical protein IT372_04460 [Polyangiaceae bacterium]|nr:hypothetical protein [Polyangiaceae bacterium]